MSKAKELLLECKIKLNVQTDYKLAKALEIERARVSDYMTEKRIPDVYACVRIAMALRRDPAEVIAEIKADTARNDKRRAFWVDFLQRAKQAARLGTLAAICILTLLGGAAAAVSGFSRSPKRA